jgi:hypothetical protein
MGKTKILAPTGSLVSISNTSLENDSMGYLAEDLQISLSSTFTDLVSWRPPAFLTAVINTFNNSFKTELPNGNFEQFGLQIWESTAPISISFNIDLYMGMSLSGYNNPLLQGEMVAIARALLKLPLPKKQKDGIGLLPPGPDLTALFASGSVAGVKANGTGIHRIEFGNGVIMEQAVVKSVQPTVSRFATNNPNQPIYIKLSIEAQGIFTAIQEQIDSWWT